MEKLNVTVSGVRVFNEKKEIPTVTLYLEKPIKGFSRKVNDDQTITFEESDVDHISFGRSALTRELCAVNELIDEYRGCRPNAFDQKAFGLIIRNATLTIVREFHAAGEVKPDSEDGDDNESVFARDCYTTHVVGVELAKKAIARLNEALTLD